MLYVSKGDGQEKTFNLNDLVTTAEFGEPIYPYLQYVDSISKAPDSNLLHTLIEADNYHTLQLLEYLYARKIDCIYIEIIIPRLMRLYYKKQYLRSVHSIYNLLEGKGRGHV